MPIFRGYEKDCSYHDRACGAQAGFEAIAGHGWFGGGGPAGRFWLATTNASRGCDAGPKHCCHWAVYEVASIKPNKSDNGLFRMMFEQDGFSAASVTLRMPIRTAYEVNDHQIIGVPIWLNSEKYDIEARMDSSVTDGLQKISEDQRRVEKRRMLQALLADRFKLMLHRETKQLLACTYWSLPRTAPNFRRPNPATLTRRE